MSIRQEKFAKLLQREIAGIFQQWMHSKFEGKMIMVNEVSVSPDLGYAKIFLGFLKPAERNYILSLIEYHAHEIRKELASHIRNQVRVIPELQFLIDDTMDHALKMDELFKKLNIPKDEISSEE